VMDHAETIKHKDNKIFGYYVVRITQKKKKKKVKQFKRHSVNTLVPSNSIKDARFTYSESSESHNNFGSFAIQKLLI
jgi:hypothetical protein